MFFCYNQFKPPESSHSSPVVFAIDNRTQCAIFRVTITNKGTMQKSHQLSSDDYITHNGEKVQMNVVESIHHTQIELLYRRLAKLEDQCVKFKRLKILDETQLGALLQDFAEDVLHTKDSQELNELINEYIQEV